MDKGADFIKLFNELSDAVFRHCYLRVSDREKARDITSETFTRTWKCISEGQEIKNTRAFVYKIANNLIIDEYRKKKDSSLEALREGGFDQGTDLGTRIHRLTEGKEMLELLYKIEGSYREVVIMRYIDDMTPKEIAKVLGESENAVSVRINRGIKKIRDILDHEK